MSGEGRPRLPVVDAANLALAIAGTRWHPEITDSLVERATTAAKESGVEDLLVVRVAGAVELPVIAQELARHYDAVVCLGAVIRGGTPHFEYVAGEAAGGLAAAAQSSAIPIVFGVLTTESIEQAIERAGTKAGNKGWDAAVSAVEMVSLAAALDAAGF